MFRIIKKFSGVILLLIIGLFTTALAGGEDLTGGAAEALMVTIDQHGPFGLNIYTVIIGFFSIWLVLIGLMCQSLDKIPGIEKAKKVDSGSGS